MWTKRPKKERLRRVVAILDVGLEKPWAIMNLIAMNTMHANSFEEAQVS